MTINRAGYAKRYKAGDSLYYRHVVAILHQICHTLPEVSQEELATLVGGYQIGRYITSSLPNQSLRRAMDNAEGNGLCTKINKADPVSGGIKVYYQLHLEFMQKPLIGGLPL